MTEPGAPRLIRVGAPDELATALAGNGIDIGRPVLVCVGGAAGMSDGHSAALLAGLRDVVVPALDRLRACVVDGGTDSGVMRLVGRARSEASAQFPLIGVAAAGTVRIPGEPTKRDDAAPLEPHHTHVVLVPGDEWGDESPWLSLVAQTISAGQPSATLLVNGGSITLQDAEASLAAGRPLIVLDGTGRAADDIASATTDPTTRTGAIAKSPLTTIVDALDAQAIADAVGAALAIR